MYRIIGSDGREYGPVSAEQLRRWIAEGRANAQTLGQTAGSTDWKPLGSFPEFSHQFVSVTALASPPPFAPAPVAARPRTNGNAIAGLIMGVLGCTPVGWVCCIPLFSILGIIYSSNGLSEINRNPTLQTGKGLAVTGLVFSVLGLVAPLALAGLFHMARMGAGYPFLWHRQWHF
jgi:uncharacterized protein DUF4190/uncharacterized protein DUF4339